VREWRRTSYEALVGCSGASGARDCGCGVAEAADDGEQRGRRWSGGVLSGEEAEEAKCGRMSRTKKRHEQAGAAAVDRRHDMAASGDGGAAWHAREKTAGRR
jgi:hypothetical protein